MEAKILNYVGHLQKLLDSISTDTFVVSSERNLNTDSQKVNVIVHSLLGSFYENSSSQPYQLEILTYRPDDVIAIFTNLGKNRNGKQFIEMLEDENGDLHEYTCFEYFNSPSVVEASTDFATNSYSRLICFVNVNILYDVSNVSKIAINGEIIDFTTGTLSYTTELFSKRVSGEHQNVSVKKASTTSLTLSKVSKNSLFMQNVFNIIFGKLDGNKVFNVDIELTNGMKATLPMIMSADGFSFAKNTPTLPSHNITLVLADNESVGE